MSVYGEEQIAAALWGIAAAPPGTSPLPGGASGDCSLGMGVGAPTATSA